MSATAGGLTVVLHTHLPWVLHHGRWPHGSDWLCEAVADCYLPLLEVMEPRARAGSSLGITLSLSPVLLEQLESPSFATEMRAFLVARRAAAREDARQFAGAGRAPEAELARRWADESGHRLAGWNEAPDLVARFRALAATGAVELIACAATHGYLPLLGTPAAVRRQVELAVESHQRRFGAPPRGLWLPECAYRPAGPWRSAVEPDVQESWRSGVESVLEACGLEYFFVEAHLVDGGTPLNLGSEPQPTERRAVPAARPARGPTTERAYRAGDSGVACLGRDPATSQQVWSRHGGYPGDPAYREFHKRQHPGGLRYWAVTDVRTGLEHKAVYDPAVAAKRVAAHARHFLDGIRARCRPRAGNALPVICALYDTELFGHWWYEGPAFLAAVLDGARALEVPLATASRQVGDAATLPPLALPEGSWGSGGGHATWLAPGTPPMWRELHRVERRFEEVARRGWDRAYPRFERLMRQALRELLLFEASDWPFLVAQGAARDYAESRAAAHARDALRLLTLATRILDRPAHRSAEALHPDDETFLAECEGRDPVFPWLDWRAGLAPRAVRLAPLAERVQAARAAPRAPVPASRRAPGNSAGSIRSRAGRRPRRGAPDSRR